MGLLILAIFTHGLVTTAKAAVTLLYFRGIAQDSAITLEWATGTEFDTVGFMIERSPSFSGPYIIQDNIGFIPSAGSVDGLTGAEYSVLDEGDILNGVTYWYRLVEFERDGSENRSEFIFVTAGVQQDTNTVSSATLTPTSEQSVQTTPETNASSSPTATNISQSGTETQITPTPSPTGTRSPASNINRSQNALTPDSEEIVSNGNVNNNRSSNSLQLTATPDDYPGPESSGPNILDLEQGLESYPAPSMLDSFDDSAAYPPDNRSFDDGRAIPGLGNLDTSQLVATRIGNVTSDRSDTNLGSSTQNPLHTLLLWVGFLASFMIFIAGVVGSIYYYRRQNPK